MKQILQLFGGLESLIVKHFNSVIVVRLTIVIILNHRSYIFSGFFAMICMNKNPKPSGRK